MSMPGRVLWTLAVLIFMALAIIIVTFQAMVAPALRDKPPLPAINAEETP